MHKSKISFQKITFLTLFSFLLSFSFGQNTNFKLVIDAGHGGKDTGAKGYTKGSYEKNITLKVSKKFGNLVKKNHKDVAITYTRQNDKFVSLKGRANMANKKNADLFVSIHCNSNQKHSPHGTETYVLGLHRTQTNFEVAKRENSVILLEDNHEVTYEGFDPNSPESVIGLTLLKSNHLDNSIRFAQLVQQKFTHKAKRKNRGVKQAGFLVIRETAMPAVLIEIGFISNKEENRYLLSDAGQNKIATSIYEAFRTFKKEIKNKTDISSISSQTDSKPKKTVKEPVKEIKKKTSEKAFYSVQFLASSKRRKSALKRFNGTIEYYKNNRYNYAFGEYKSIKSALNAQKKAQKKGYKDAFVIGFLNGNRVRLSTIKSYLN